jgi:WD40 repeat protein
MRGLRVTIAALIVAGVARAEPPVDEDALPDGATARLGSRQRRWRDTFAHAFVDDGRTLLTVHAGPLLQYRDLATGRLIRVRKLGDFTPDAAALSADGKVLSIARGGALEIWDVPGERRLREFAINPNDARGREPYLVRLTGDGSAALTADGGRVAVHDVKTGASRVLLQQAEAVHTLAIVLGGRGVLIGDPGQVRCVDFASGEVQWVRKGRFEKDQTNVLPGGRLAWLPIRSPKLEPGLYDLDTGWPADAQPHDDARSFKCASPDGRTGCVKEPDGFALRELFNGKLLAELPELRDPLGFAPDGRSLLGRDRHYCLQRWDAGTGRPLFPDLPAPAHLDVNLLAFRPDGALVSGCEEGGLFRQWDPATRRPKNLLQIRDGKILHTFALLADGRRLVHRDRSSELDFWDLDEAKLLISIDAPKPFGYRRMEVQASGDRRTLYSLFPVWNGGVSFALQAWDVKTGETRLERLEPRLAGALALSPDASRFASAMSGVHDTATGRLLSGLPVDGLTIQRLLFAPDQARLAAAFAPAHAASGGVALCETATGRLVRRLPTAATGPMAFSPDGRRLVTASAEALQVWDSFSGRELKRWAIPDAARGQPMANVLAISLDAKTLASGHTDGTILLWPLPAREPTRRLSAAERDKAWGDLAAADAKDAWLAAARLADSPTDALSLLGERLTPAVAPSPERVQALIGGLAASSFARRDSAEKELAQSVDLIEELLRKSLTASRSPEQASRLRQLLDGPRTLTSPERVRRWRALAVLEQIGSPEAKRLLELVANGPAGSIESDAAKSGLQRLQARSAPP